MLNLILYNRQRTVAADSTTSVMVISPPNMVIFTNKYGHLALGIPRSYNSYNHMIFSTTYVLYMFGIAYLFFMCTNGGSKKSYFKTLATCTIDKPRDMHANLSALFRLPDFMGDLANAGLCLGIFFGKRYLVKHIASPKKLEK